MELEKKFTVIPDKFIWSITDKQSGNFHAREKIDGETRYFTNSLQFTPKKALYITGIEILNQVHPLKEVTFNKLTGFFEEVPFPETYAEDSKITVHSGHFFHFNLDVDARYSFFHLNIEFI